MKVTDFTKRCLAWRRERKNMEADGFVYADLRRELIGAPIRAVIRDVKIATDGTGLWIKVK